MRKALRVVPIALVVAGLLSASVIAPAAAGADGADYVVWRFPASGPRGLGFIRDGTSNTTMIAETVGLRPNASYRLVGSSALCGTGHQASNVVWSKNFQANGKGAAFMNTTLDGDAVTPSLRSIRLFKGSGQADCAKPLRSQSGGGTPADAFVTFTAYGARLAVFVDLRSGKDLLTAVGHGFLASHGYRLVASNAACPAQPTVANTPYERSGTTNSQGIFWRNDSASIASTEPPRSIQLFNHQSTRVACATPTRLPTVQ